MFFNGKAVLYATVVFCMSLAVICTAGAEELLLHWQFGAQEDRREEDITGRGHTGQLLRANYNRPYPERVSEGVHGAEAGSVRLNRESSVVLLKPLQLPERWTLSFWIRDERPPEQIGDTLSPGEIISIRTRLIGLDRPWHFRKDPGAVGLEEGWHKAEDTGAWGPMPVPAFWGETHVGGGYHGYGWYKTHFYVPRDLAGMEHELYFSGVDEQAWVYVNGNYVGEQSVEATGKTIGDLWNEPFSVTVGPEYLRGGEDNLLAVRTHAAAHGAGIFRPVYFLTPQHLLHEADFTDIRGQRVTAGDWEHVTLTAEPGRTTLYINGLAAASAESTLRADEAGTVKLEFMQRGEGYFSGRLDDVRLYEGVLSGRKIAELSADIYHPEAGWLTGYDESMQKLAGAGRLSKERLEYMAGLGAPDTGLLIERLEGTDEPGEKLDVIWALGVYGGLEAVSAIIGRIDSGSKPVASAAEETLKVFHEEGVFPETLEEKGDETAVLLLEKVLSYSTDIDLQQITADSLRAVVGDYRVVKLLIEKLISDRAELVDPATRGLLRLHEENVYPDVLIERGGEESERLLEKSLRHTPDKELQWASAAGLKGVTDGYRVCVVLIEKLGSDRAELASAAEDGLKRARQSDLYPRFLRERGDEEAALLLGQVLDKARDIGLQTASLESLTVIGGEKALDVLHVSVREGNWWIRRQAARILHEQGLETDAELADEAAGWPMWRCDPGRSARTPALLSGDLHLQWVRELPGPRRAWRHQWDDRGKLDFDASYAPVAAGRRVFVPSNATDSLTAYSIDDGAELWRFYAGGPVRLAPAVWRGRVYFVSDDGYLYCLDAASGELDWKFRGGPSDRRLLGNERIINFWAARGGPAVKDGTVYFAAGLWPLHGVFIYALDAENGDVVWVNDTVSSDYVPLPHGGAYGYGGIAPQGYIAVNEDQLVVSGGRGREIYLDRSSGAVIHLDARAGGKGAGGYGVHAGGMGKIRNDMLAERVESVSDRIGGEVFYKLAAHDRLVVTTAGGKIYCFGPDEVDARRHEFNPSVLEPHTNNWAEAAGDLLNELGETEGYALLLGAGSGDLLKELLLRSEMHIVVVESDPERVRALRDELSGAGLYGRRAAVVEADPAAFSVQPYLFSLVVSEDAAAAGFVSDRPEPRSALERLRAFAGRRPDERRVDGAALASALGLLRPYGGLAFLAASQEDAAVLGAAAAETGVDGVFVELSGSRLLARRHGPLSGAGQWTHQYHDAANTLLSHDERVRLPLGILWFGGPVNHDILPRHSGGPRPQVAGGRQVYLGVETIGARCVYTGRQLWIREFPGLGHPFTNLELEEQWAEGKSVYMTNIPGATYIGSPFVTLPDSIYLRYERSILRLDPATGDIIAEFSLPGRSVKEIYGDEDAPEWGHVSVQGDLLIATSEPHVFEDQQLGWINSYSGTSSRRLAVMDRYSGEVLWEREARVGFRHTAVISSDDTLYLIDGLSENALDHLARRGRTPEEPSTIFALGLRSGSERWRRDSDVFGTFMLYSRKHDILVEGGSRDMRRPFGDEPARMAARDGSTGELIWVRDGGFTLPGAIRGEMLIPGRPGTARSLLTGEDWLRRQPLTGEQSAWNYRRAYGCNTLNASKNLLFYRSGYAGFFDLEHDSGTGTFGGFRSGCTANMIAADGVLSALDYTRTCTCSYALQTSLALVHMPDDPGIEFWTRYDGSPPDPAGYGINFGAPGRRVDVAGEGLVWHVWPDEGGMRRRHPSAILDSGGGPDWMAASVREGVGEIIIDNLLNRRYTVRLYFTEPDWNAEAGERIFDVLAEPAPAVRFGRLRRWFGLKADRKAVLQGFDIARDAGGAMRGVAKEYSVDVEDGRIIIELRRAAGSGLDPVISGIELKAEGLQ